MHRWCMLHYNEATSERLEVEFVAQTFDFLVEGFVLKAMRFSTCVRPLCVPNYQQSLGIGLY
jgi:hypothetical protein